MGLRKIIWSLLNSVSYEFEEHFNRGKREDLTNVRLKSSDWISALSIEQSILLSR